MTNSILLSEAKNICTTGGAPGADQLFYECAVGAGHSALHYTFMAHHKAVKKLGHSHTILQQEELEIADIFLREVRSKFLIKRVFPTQYPYANNLLRRNHWIVKDADTVYAVSVFDEDGLIAGGTAWGVYMSIIANKLVNVFDQNRGQWYTYSRFSWIPVDWVALPRGKYAGIGSRDLFPKGIKAIKDLYVEQDNSNRHRDINEAV